MTTDLRIAGNGSYAVKLARAKRFIEDKQVRLYDEMVVANLMGSGAPVIGVLKSTVEFGWMIVQYDGSNQPVNQTYGLRPANAKQKATFTRLRSRYQISRDGQGRYRPELEGDAAIVDYYIDTGIPFDRDMGRAFLRYCESQGDSRVAARQRLARLRRELVRNGVHVESDPRAQVKRSK